MFKENILNAVYDYQYKYGVSYAKTSDTTYKSLRIAAVISYIYLSIMSLLYIVGFAITGGSGEVAHLLQVSIISLILYTAAFVIMFFKLNLIAVLLNIVATIVKLPAILPFFEEYPVNTNVYWRIIIPVALVVIISLIMCFISTREKLIIKRDYKIVMDKLYNQHHTENMSDEDWEKFIDNYKK